ncbi:DNA-directed RNA polymerase I subunit rpa49-like [Cucurbita moschata]|uniref:DNA-directed RNA polymerase I subunit rpa49-like n=1 Tax=Cucurbita moschata TaxID=3662 RepID=A0A6J1HM51_CUCMO|nr:DNA-directed RNA polymerase I subunit rpa49-like [Cucurbita moschata]XP_022964096.1 DNA-directed RNA polymerase I subunit rpa49-like [Cucurbita moschata]XP_022964097.1 DNA-directed RNA polymerase I subunit rpa49-like [Cucurbita moschata]XP_022964098.1 DNA-directed RNA polymerase I subunit rpa49-like [Cucurbita moschata]XP_022964099.1 DNA-directed RNA polymerase I subunit rpa49-like [Cucurbita moschata]
MAGDSKYFEETHYAEPEANSQSPAKKKKKSEKKKKRVPPVNTKIQVLSNHPEKIPPLVGYFPSGYDPNKDPNEEVVEEQNSVRAKVYRHKKKPNRMQLVVSPTGSNVDFVGTNYLGEATAGKQHCSYALGVLDKATQSLKIVPIASNMIFRLDPKVRGSDVPENESPSVANDELSVQEKADRMRELSNLYGTKKSIKQAKKLLSLKQEDDPETKKDLDGKMKNVVVNKEALESSNAQISRNIPTYNASATTPQEAYPLDKIILKGEWGFLEDLYFLLQAESEISANYPSFVRNRIYKLQDIQDEEEKKKLCCIYSYITHLIKYKDQHSMDGVSSVKGHKIPSMLRQKFSSMFSTTESRRLSAEKTDLLISHVLVLALFPDEFSSDPSDIARDLRTSPFTLRVHYDNLGCKFIRKNNLSLVTLPVPLQFPELRRKRRR